MDFFHQLIVFIAFGVAGAINAIAGGGTVFSFTALAWVGLPLVQANATNATALVPGSLGSAYALRSYLLSQRRAFLILLIPTIIGSLLGAFVVANTSEAIFRRLVPFLVLFATLIFASRDLLARLVLRQASIVDKHLQEHVTPFGYALGCGLQFLISFYGGYFGAGIGILMLTSMSLMGMRDLLRMNGLKAMLAVFINGTAAVFFILDGKVLWSVAGFAAVAALIGGYVLAWLARFIDQRALRIIVIVAGVVVSIWLYIRLQ